MQIRTVSLISMAVGSGIVALVLLLYVLDQWSGYATAKDVLNETQQLSIVLSIPETLNFERALINARLIGNIGTSEQLDQVNAQLKRADDSFRQASQSASPATQNELQRIYHTLQSLREVAIAETLKPLNQRGVGSDQQYRTQMFDLQAAAYRIAEQLQRHISAMDQTAGRATHLALLAWQLRDWSGRETTTLISIVGQAMPMVGEQVETLAIFKGRLDQMWLELESVADRIDEPEINAAVQAAKRAFWEQGGEAFTRWVVPNRGALVSFDVDQFVRDIRLILDKFLPIRDEAMKEARHASETQLGIAKRNVENSLLLAFFIVCAGGASFWWLDRRVLRAVAEITTTLHRLATGERHLQIPMQDRTDELGLMSRAIEVLRSNAITAEALQQTRAEEEAQLYLELAVRNETLAHLNEELKVSASTDALTGLANRKAFEMHLGEMIAKAAQGQSYALHFVDLDLFKQVNDTFGHPTGDALLQAVASRLRGCVRATDVVARLGGDEFAILQDAADRVDADELASRVTAALRQPYTVQGHRCIIGASIGIMVDEDGLNSPEIVLHNADLALYEAKAGGRGVARAFGPELLARPQVLADKSARLDRAEQPDSDLQVKVLEGVVDWAGYPNPTGC